MYSIGQRLIPFTTVTNPTRIDLLESLIVHRLVNAVAWRRNRPRNGQPTQNDSFLHCQQYPEFAIGWSRFDPA